MSSRLPPPPHSNVPQQAQGHGPPPEKRRRVDDGGPPPNLAMDDDDDELFMDDDDDIFLDPQALAILTQADAQAQSANAASLVGGVPAQPPPAAPAPVPTQHITMSLPPGKQPVAYTGTNGSARAYHVPIAGGGAGRIVAHLPSAAPPGHAPAAGPASAAASFSTSSDDSALRTEIARLESQLQTRVGEAAMLRQKLATVQAEQRKAETDKREFEERVRLETEAKMASMMQELNKVKSEMTFQEHTIRESQRRVGRIQFSQATAAGAPASPMRSPVVLRSAVSASGLGRMGLMRPPSMHMQPPPMGPPHRFGGSQFPSYGHGGPGASSALATEIAEAMVSSEDRMDVDALDAPIMPPPPPVTTEHVQQPPSSPPGRAKSPPRPAKIDVATSPPPSSPTFAPRQQQPEQEPPAPAPLSYPPHILTHIHALLQLVPTLHPPPDLCTNLLTALTSPPPTSATTLFPSLAQVLTHITPQLRTGASDPIVNTALTTAHLAHWLARHSTAAPPSTFAPRLVPAFLDTICAAATFHFRATYPAASTPPSAPTPPPTWPSTLIPLLFSTLHLLFTRSPTPNPSLLALPSSAYLTVLEPEYLAHARDWPACVHLALAQWAHVVFAYANPAPMLAQPAGRSLLSVLVKLAHRSPDVGVVCAVLGAVHVLAARWPAQVAGRWVREEGVALVVERVHREAHLMVYGAQEGEREKERERVEAVRNGLRVVYMLVVYCARADAAVRLQQLIAPGGSDAGGVAGVWTQTRLMATLADVNRWVAERGCEGDGIRETMPRSLRQRVEARRLKAGVGQGSKEKLAHSFDLDMISELEAAVGAVVVPGSTQTQQSLTQVTVTQTQTQVA